MKTVLAIDLGASSGRGIIFSVRNGKFVSEEVHRFPNGALSLGGGLFWDAEYLFGEIKTAIKKGAERARIDGVGIDTWGVDYGFADSVGNLVSKVRNYRDARTVGAVENCGISAENLYKIGGIAPNEINTVYQLWSERGKRVGVNGAKFLMMPQLFGAMLTGIAAAEPTVSSTTAFFGARGFDKEVSEKIGLDAGELPEVRQTGSVLGNVKSGILRELGIDYEIPVILTPGHDTACAVLGIPCTVKNPLFISSGTWSLFGAELDAPVLSEAAFREGYSNELGYGGTVRFLKNIMGLWILQECRRQWKEEGRDYSFAGLADLASAEKSPGVYIDVGDELFKRPDKMADRVRCYVRTTQNCELSNVGAVVRCVLESLAMEYKFALEGLKKLTSADFTRIHIIGGGSQNKLLDKMVADSLGTEVSAGPAESTAMGNAAAQLICLGELSGVSEARQTVAATCPPETFVPEKNEDFREENYRKYLKLKQKA